MTKKHTTERYSTDDEPVLTIRKLGIEIDAGNGPITPVRDVNLTVAAGEIHALVGESGAGKSVTARSTLRLGMPPARILRGGLAVSGVDVGNASADELRELRGGRAGMVFQEPSGSLNPGRRAGIAVVEAIRLHTGLSRRQAWERALELAAALELRDPERSLRSYPHELSGGMQQRVAIAAALGGDPALLVADEPTTALDARVAEGLLELLRRLARERGLAVLLVTHDLAGVAAYADTVSVMYAGCVVEQAPAARLFEAPLHPYTQNLLMAQPVPSRRGEALWYTSGPAPEPHESVGGCPYAARCPIAEESCARIRPVFLEYRERQRCACTLVPKYVSALLGEEWGPALPLPAREHVPLNGVSPNCGSPEGHGSPGGDDA